MATKGNTRKQDQDKPETEKSVAEQTAARHRSRDTASQEDAPKFQDAPTEEERLKDKKYQAQPLESGPGAEHPSPESDAGQDDKRAEQEKGRTDIEPVAGENTMAPSQVMLFTRQEGDNEFVPAPALQTFTHMMARQDSDAITGHFVDVVGGEYEGRYGVLDYVASVDKFGNPLTGVVETRDNDAMRIIVDFKDLRRAEAGRR